MMAAERGAARNTLDAYRRDLEDYAGSIDGGVLMSAPKGSGPGSRTSRRGLKASSAARRLSAVRQLHKFLFAEGLRTMIPPSR